MKKLITAALFSFGFAAVAAAQIPVEGTSYYLPRTALRFTMLVEKTTYEPGQFAIYAGRYMKKTDVTQEPDKTYRIISTKMVPVAVPDTSKHYTLMMDKKHSITKTDIDVSGILLAVNGDGKEIHLPASFVSARKPDLLNPKDYMTEEILAAGSSAKMAELCAQEIYDIRDSRNQLSRGQADNMPKDGEQLKLMFANLNTQEQALLQLFDGVTHKDTTETVMTFIPVAEVSKQLYFRFSKKLGFTDIDDLGGAPFYISIEDEHIAPKQEVAPEDKKKSKDEIGLNVNLPGKIKITLFEQEKPMASFETYAGQFGAMENLSGELFGKKQTCHIILNPITGGIDSIQGETLK